MSNVTTGTTGYDQFDFLFVRANLSGGILVGVFYGMVLILYVRCMQALWHMRTARRVKNTTVLMTHTTTVFIMNTLYLASISRVLELTFVDNDSFPGGPLAYLNLEFFIPLNVLGSIVFLIANWLNDGLMLWRCAVIWGGPFTNYVLIFPSLVLIGSFISGVLLTIVTCQPNTSLWTHVGISAALPYYILSLSLNIILTFMIVLRLLMHRRRVRTALGRVSEPYTSLAAFIIESAAPYSALSLIYLVLVIINNPVQQIFLGIMSGAQIIANYMIILRVASGSAWSSETSASVLTTLTCRTGENIRVTHRTEISLESGDMVRSKSVEESISGGSTLSSEAQKNGEPKF